MNSLRTLFLAVLLGNLLFGPAIYAKTKAHSATDTTDTSSASSTPAPSVKIEKTKRDVPAATKKQVYDQVGIPKAVQKYYVIDHKVPLELGGSNAKANLQPQLKSDAKGKDAWENYLSTQVKSGKMTLPAAQAEIQQPHPAPPPKP